MEKQVLEPDLQRGVNKRSNSSLISYHHTPENDDNITLDYDNYQSHLLSVDVPPQHLCFLDVSI